MEIGDAVSVRLRVGASYLLGAFRSCPFEGRLRPVLDDMRNVSNAGVIEKDWVAISQAETFSSELRPNPNNLPEVPSRFTAPWRPITALRSQPFTEGLTMLVPMVISLLEDLQAFYSDSDIVGSIRSAADDSDNQVMSILMDAKLIFSAIAAVIEPDLEDGSGCSSCME